MKDRNNLPNGEPLDRGVQRVFDDRASSYYDDNYGKRVRDSISGHLQRRQQWMQDLAGSGSGSGRVLELGCGPGALAESLSDSGKQVVAFDLSFSMLQSGRSRLSGSGLAVHFCAGRAQTLPFADGSFDEVLAAGVLKYVPELEQALSEIARVLRPEGRAILSFPLHRIWYERCAGANAHWIPTIRALMGRGGGRSRSNPRLRHRFQHVRFRPRLLRSMLSGAGWTIERAVNHQFVFLPWDILFPIFSARLSVRLERLLPRALQPWLAKSTILVVRPHSSGARGG